MPSKYEIYDNHAKEYDELVNHEDYQNNLTAFLQRECAGFDTVLEFGAGTGRVTGLYADRVGHIFFAERAQHMIDRAAENLAAHQDKITFINIDTRDLAGLNIKADCIIEGWALGHTAIDEHHRLADFLSELFTGFRSLLNVNGRLIFIETMGSHVDQPVVPRKELAYLYRELETTYRMKRHILETDYKFASVEEARRIMGFFFGQEMAASIDSEVVREYTGVWVGALNPA